MKSKIYILSKAYMKKMLNSNFRINSYQIKSILIILFTASFGFILIQNIPQRGESFL